jgi:hypothetical protein
VKTALLAVLALLGQRLLGAPGMPDWSSLVVVPAVVIVAPALLEHGRRRILPSMLLGLGWDLVLEPVVGPGGIAWSATALALGGLAGIVADRSVKAWFGFGMAAALLLAATRAAALAPLGLSLGLTPWRLLVYTVATGLWCALVGWLRTLDLPSRWRVWRARRLR